MAIEKEVLDQLLAGRDPKDVFGKDGPVHELKKALSERILNTEYECLSNFGADSLPITFTGDLRFSNGESTPCELAFEFHRLCLVGWCLTA